MKTRKRATGSGELRAELARLEDRLLAAQAEARRIVTQRSVTKRNLSAIGRKLESLRAGLDEVAGTKRRKE